jgi:hypothetical protein
MDREPVGTDWLSLKGKFLTGKAGQELETRLPGGKVKHESLGYSAIPEMR